MRPKRQIYRDLCTVEKSIPIFSRDWWLDAVAGLEGWDVALVEKGGQIVASMPYVMRKRWGFTILTQPQLTQSLGPWIKSSGVAGSSELGRQKDLMQALIDRLPRFHDFSQNFNHNVVNWLPFFWRGFSQTTRYTYLLTHLDDEDRLWRGLHSNIRGDIRKASQRFSLVVRTDVEIEDFIKLNRMVFKRQGLPVPYPAELVRRIDSACTQRNSRRIFVAQDGRGQLHAGVYLIWDENSAYYLLGGGDPVLRNSGATSLCMWEAIKFSATVARYFDFEGSMIEPVERFCRAFGATQTPYFNIYKTPSRVLSAARAARSFLSR